MHNTTVDGYRVGDRGEASASYAGYAVHDPLGRKVGSVRAVFANGSGEPEYINVKLGVLGRCVLLPVQGVAVDEERQTFVLQ